MVVVVTLEARFDRTPDGKIWTVTMFPYSFWMRYLEVFDGVRAMARVRDVAEPPAGALRADGERVEFHAVPYYVGPWQYAKRAMAVRRAIADGIHSGDAVMLRINSTIACIAERELHRRGHPFAVEVTGDPYDGFAPGALPHPLRPFFRWYFTRATRRQCRRACAAAYVTRSALQARYPAGEGAFATWFSDVVLPEDGEACKTEPRQSFPRGSRMRLIMVGGLERLYKAPDVLIDAVEQCVSGGLDIELTFVGDGECRPGLQRDAIARGLGERIRFLGMLPAGECVRNELDQADLFVLPSRQEGLPRAMIEAMAQGLPCIGSTVGGIPELLQADEMVPPGDVGGASQEDQRSGSGSRKDETHVETEHRLCEAIRRESVGREAARLLQLRSPPHRRVFPPAMKSSQPRDLQHGGANDGEIAIERQVSGSRGGLVEVSQRAVEAHAGTGVRGSRHLCETGRRGSPVLRSGGLRPVAGPCRARHIALERLPFADPAGASDTAIPTRRDRVSPEQDRVRGNGGSLVGGSGSADLREPRDGPLLGHRLETEDHQVG